MSESDIKTVFDDFNGFSRSLKASIGCTEKGTHIINLTFSRDHCVIKLLVDCREIISKLD
ncbi:hypothetical protein FK85_23165 [Halorubrum saccharovorum]|uniref:Uncharacterized protein n=1 Tax=Halorubrum saccharovorum TaxID=2248 RepID=A0A0F8D785_9EURY|nr:hypothetical protein FK85_23165 [Halorubrum saccharovorum]